MSTTPITTSAGLAPSEGKEVWRMTLPGSIRLYVTRPNRLGQQVQEPLEIGPNRVGHQFQISQADREENQNACIDAIHDPFRNGMLVRADADQQNDPNTRSEDALDDADLIDITDLDQEAFESRVAQLGQVPVRRLLEIATRLDISHRKVSWLADYVRDTYAVGGSQRSVTERDGSGS